MRLDSKDDMEACHLYRSTKKLRNTYVQLQTKTADITHGKGLVRPDMSIDNQTKFSTDSEHRQ